MRGVQVSNKTFTLLGVMLLAVGSSALALAGFSVYMTEQACQGGNSPVPDQGCGYIFNPAFWQDTPQQSWLTYGPVAIALGIISLIAARLESLPRKPNPKPATTA
jgi:hypothetical protein